MTEIKEEMEVPAKPARTIQKLVAHACDICGKRSYRKGEWTHEPYEVLEIEIEKREGSNYLEDYDVDTTTYHCCPECWESHVVPLFKTGPTKTSS